MPQIFLTASGTFAPPADWNGYADKIECVAAGGQGAAGTTALSGGGGGGGEYAAEVTATGAVLALNAGAAYTIGSAASGTATTITAGGITITAHAGGNASGITHGSGGTGSTNTTHFDGGAGGDGYSTTTHCPGAGGGGSGGPLAAGAAGASAAHTAGWKGSGGGADGSVVAASQVAATAGTAAAAGGAGGTPDGGTGGNGLAAAGTATAGAASASSHNFNATHGVSGGGAGGGGNSGTTGTRNGGAGGAGGPTDNSGYGGGGGGGGSAGTAGGALGAGMPGLIVITYSSATLVPTQGSAQVIVYPTPQYWVLAPGTLLYRPRYTDSPPGITLSLSAAPASTGAAAGFTPTLGATPGFAQTQSQAAAAIPTLPGTPQSIATTAGQNAIVPGVTIAQNFAQTTAATNVFGLEADAAPQAVGASTTAQAEPLAVVTGQTVGLPGAATTYGAAGFGVSPTLPLGPVSGLAAALPIGPINLLGVAAASDSPPPALAVGLQSLLGGAVGVGQAGLDATTVTIAFGSVVTSAAENAFSFPLVNVALSSAATTGSSGQFGPANFLPAEGSISVIVYQGPQHNVLAPGRLYYRPGAFEAISSASVNLQSIAALASVGVFSAPGFVLLTSTAATSVAASVAATNMPMAGAAAASGAGAPLSIYTIFNLSAVAVGYAALISSAPGAFLLGAAASGQDGQFVPGLGMGGPVSALGQSGAFLLTYLLQTITTTAQSAPLVANITIFPLLQGVGSNAGTNNFIPIYSMGFAATVGNATPLALVVAPNLAGAASSASVNALVTQYAVALGYIVAIGQPSPLSFIEIDKPGSAASALAQSGTVMPVSLSLMTGAAALGQVSSLTVLEQLLPVATLALAQPLSTSKVAFAALGAAPAIAAIGSLSGSTTVFLTTSAASGNAVGVVPTTGIPLTSVLAVSRALNLGRLPTLTATSAIGAEATFFGGAEVPLLPLAIAEGNVNNFILGISYFILQSAQAFGVAEPMGTYIIQPPPFKPPLVFAPFHPIGRGRLVVSTQPTRIRRVVH